MSEPQEIKDIIKRSLIHGPSIQVGNLRIITSRSMKLGDPPSDVSKIRLVIKNDDTMTVILPKSTNRFDVLYRVLQVLIWLGEGLTGEKATLVEDV